MPRTNTCPAMRRKDMMLKRCYWAFKGLCDNGCLYDAEDALKGSSPKDKTRVFLYLSMVVVTE